MDKLSPEARSRNMAKIKSKNTKTEMAVRSMLHAHGYRFRLNKKELPGKPDIVLKKYKTVIFVHGCFWHRHENCKDATFPKSNTDFWFKKFQDNTQRDKLNHIKLTELGWKVVIVWECELRNKTDLVRKLLSIKEGQTFVENS